MQDSALSPAVGGTVHNGVGQPFGIAQADSAPLVILSVVR